MEFALNLAWIALAALMCWLWMRHAAGGSGDRRMQIVALALIILIMFPVISVTDDLLTAQNPEETDSIQRRDHVCARAHSELHPVSESILPVLAELSFDSVSLAMPDSPPAQRVMAPAAYSIQSRPPPAA